MGDRDQRGLVRDSLREVAIRGLAPGHSDAYVALGIAYQKKGDLPRAKECAMRAPAADPRNPMALKNLVAINGQGRDCLDSNKCRFNDLDLRYIR